MKKHYATFLFACFTTLGSVALAANVTGSGTTNYVPLWTSGSAIGDSVMYQSSGNIGVGTKTPGYALDVSGAVNTSLTYRIGGSVVLATPGGTTSYNTAVGTGALGSATGKGNTAVGFAALEGDTTGTDNIAAGYYALSGNTSGSSNEGFGVDALKNNTTGGDNIAIGFAALENISTGGSNIALGSAAGANLTGADQNNIDIGNSGVSTDNDTIRIGTKGSHVAFFAAGVSGVKTGLSGAVDVLVDSNGQLGTVNSSIRFKEDVRDMGDASSGLMRLHPVTYRYKEPYADGSKPVDYGLIAEEVAQVYPDLVATGADGQMQTVQYHKLTPMLLNEVQKERQLVEQQAETIRQLEKRLAALEALVPSSAATSGGR